MSTYYGVVLNKENHFLGLEQIFGKYMKNVTFEQAINSYQIMVPFTDVLAQRIETLEPHLSIIYHHASLIIGIECEKSEVIKFPMYQKHVTLALTMLELTHVKQGLILLDDSGEHSSPDHPSFSSPFLIGT